ncbi:uncharacterized protein LOC121663474 [Corvus kubaryi]|uniref:uncharacterized protein LOC121663474 n=1 Tax=Corvus kubaryi TaxID=68294 RepID=UPI001C03F68F|nr:uncharacterized protein LOC121663474 [Corvus kubaryi]
MAGAGGTGGTGQSSSRFCCWSLPEVSSGLEKQKKERIYFVKCVVWFGLVCSVWPLASGWAGRAFRAAPGAGLGLELPVWDWALPSLGWAFETPFSALEKGRGRAGEVSRPRQGGTEGLREVRGPRGTLQGQGVGTGGTQQPSLCPPPCWDRAVGAGNGRIPCQTGGYLWTPVWGWLGGALPPSQAPFHPCSFSLFIIPSLIFTCSFPPLAPPFSSPLSCPIPPPSSSFPCFPCLPRAIHISSLLSPGIPNQALSDFWVKRREAETQPQAGVRAQECPWGWRGRPGPAHGTFTPRSISHSAELWLTELPGNFRTPEFKQGPRTLNQDFIPVSV